MSEKKLKDFLVFLANRDDKIDCIVDSEQELSAVVDALKTICQVENSVCSTFYNELNDDKKSFPYVIRIKSMDAYIKPRSYQKFTLKDCPWSTVEELKSWDTSDEYQKFYYGVKISSGKPIISPKFFSEYKEEDVDSTIAEYKQSLR
jgi:hypothetical protein